MVNFSSMLTGAGFEKDNKVKLNKIKNLNNLVIYVIEYLQ
jgi:hypothetical protein